MKFEWNVFVEDINGRKIKSFNIFDHYSFLQDCAKAAKFAESIEEFAFLVRRELHYYYWSKCEWEIILSSWPPSERGAARKVDVASQVELNWEHFIVYLWTNRAELIKEAKKRK